MKTKMDRVRLIKKEKHDDMRLAIKLSIGIHSTGVRHSARSTAIPRTVRLRSSVRVHYSNNK